jgi:hypothetical protein
LKKRICRVSSAGQYQANASKLTIRPEKWPDFIIKCAGRYIVRYDDLIPVHDIEIYKVAGLRPLSRKVTR